MRLRADPHRSQITWDRDIDAIPSIPVFGLAARAPCDICDKIEKHGGQKKFCVYKLNSGTKTKATTATWPMQWLRRAPSSCCASFGTWKVAAPHPAAPPPVRPRRRPPAAPRWRPQDVTRPGQNWREPHARQRSSQHGTEGQTLARDSHTTNTQTRFSGFYLVESTPAWPRSASETACVRELFPQLEVLLADPLSRRKLPNRHGG